MRPYIVRFVSLYSGVGKTFIASQVVAKLKNRGYRVGVIKHCTHGIEIEDKDTHKYLHSGADTVVASSASLGIIYQRIWIDSLIDNIKYIKTPIIMVEGFKNVDIGDSIVIVEKKEDIYEVLDIKNIISYVVREYKNHNKKYSGTPLFTFDDIDELTNIIENRAIDYIYQQLPKTDCGTCGYDNCWIFAKSYAKGETQWCPRDSEVSLVIDGMKIPLNPYVKKVLKSIVLAFIDTLKDVPKDKKKISIEINT
ncbi:MAG: molybdopterin-guanine dinucleotide biosynthesis protein B [Ignisphaera sp.]|uniref:Molybdopterin-guanine dinucleotide biosynthesis protein B n=1 Tax=Ignisphaera aggregans TaxID=334771 RepID=A0A7J3MYK6_9CREN